MAEHKDPKEELPKEEEVKEEADAAVEGEAAALSKSAKKRAAKKRAAARKAAGEGGEEGDASPAEDKEEDGEGEGEGGEGAKKKKKKKKGKKTQTWPEPTVPVSKLFPKDDEGNVVYPQGECTAYIQEYNTFRTTDEEKRHLERLENVKYNELRRGAEVHRQVRRYIQETVKPGELMIDITNRLESKVLELIEADGLQCGRAFPTGCSINNVAAHWTPNSGDKTVLQYDDVVKFDFGTHVGGRIIDCAWTHNFNPAFDPLKAAAKAATEEGIKQAGPDARLGEIGGWIQEVMESHEVEIEKKIYTVKCIENLSGHSIEPYKIHAGKSVPLIRGREMDKMEEGEVYAVETFGSTGKGHVVEDGECSHYMRSFEIPDSVRHLRHPNAKQLLGFINKHFGSLAFSRKWLDQLGAPKHLMALRQLVDYGIVDPYPPLVDQKGCYTCQYEHTILLRPTCKEVLSRGDDF